MKLPEKIKNYLFYFIFRVRPFTRKCAQKIASAAVPGEKILEIGSGWPDAKGDYYFSVKKYFERQSVNFIQSDFDSSFGLRVVDVARLDEKSEYDRIICFHVLDDVWEWQRAWNNLFGALKDGGSLHIILPAFSRLDVKRDLWRFTEKAIRLFCAQNKMNIAEFITKGFVEFPSAYFITIKK